jgi:hypothetical protein
MVYHRLRVRPATPARVFSLPGRRAQEILLDLGGWASGAVISLVEEKLGHRVLFARRLTLSKQTLRSAQRMS